MPGKVGAQESGILAWRQGQRSQGWPGWWAHKGSMYTLAVTLEGFLDMVSGIQLVHNKWVGQDVSGAQHCLFPLD